jgi:hypothetical protein
MEISSLKKYFLGLMSAKDAEALELGIISGEIGDEDLIEAENNLIESYLEGNLTIEESTAFRENFLISSERRLRVELVSSFKNLPNKSQPENNSKPIFFEQLVAFFKLRPITLVFASIGLVLLLGIGWQVFFVQKLTGIETEIIALNKQDLSDPSAFKDLKSLNLTSDSLRSAGSTNGFVESELTNTVLIRLILGAKSESTEDFAVNISGNGKSLQPFSKTASGKEVRLLLPKSLLTKGEFRISLERKGEKHNYNFTVQ